METKKIAITIPVPEEFEKLEAVYDMYYDTYNTIYDNKGNFYDVSNAIESNQKLYEICLKMIDIINNNREIFEPIKKIKMFTQIEQILSDWKRNLEDNYAILHFRKCINWLRKKDPEDTSYFL
jgi:hypothetical protein